MGAPSSMSKKCFRHTEASFQNLQEVLKTYDLIGAGHPSWVSRAHPSFPLSKFSGFIDSLKGAPNGRFFFSYHINPEKMREKCRIWKNILTFGKTVI
jgi:hypothetical protein